MPNPSLHTDRIDLWLVPVPAAVPEALSASLTAAEQKRAARFAFDRDRSVYLTARGTLRHLLGDYLTCPPKDIDLTEGPQGKPQLAPALDSQIRFNLSHSGSLVLIALTLGAEVGVDIEHGHDHFDLLELAETVFSPAERERLNRAPMHEHRALFYHHWVAKEAYIKALGGGLSIALEAFSVAATNVAPGAPFAITTGEGEAPVRGQWVEAPDGYAAAVVRGGSPWSVRINQMAVPVPTNGT